MSDSYGDGWNGATGTFSGAHDHVTFTLPHGHAGDVEICLEGCVSFEVTGGSWQSEVGWSYGGVEDGKHSAFYPKKFFENGVEVPSCGGAGGSIPSFSPPATAAAGFNSYPPPMDYNSMPPSSPPMTGANFEPSFTASYNPTGGSSGFAPSFAPSYELPSTSTFMPSTPPPTLYEPATGFEPSFDPSYEPYFPNATGFENNNHGPPAVYHGGHLGHGSNCHPFHM